MTAFCFVEAAFKLTMELSKILFCTVTLLLLVTVSLHWQPEPEGTAHEQLEGTQPG